MKYESNVAFYVLGNQYNDEWKYYSDYTNNGKLEHALKFRTRKLASDYFDKYLINGATGYSIIGIGNMFKLKGGE